jgi:hypothetical protein
MPRIRSVTGDRHHDLRIIPLLTINSGIILNGGKSMNRDHKQCTQHENWIKQRELFNLKMKVDKEKRVEEYNKNPIKCKICDNVIPYDKKHTNKFCSSSCAAKFNNKNRNKSQYTLKSGRKEKPINKCKCCGKECKNNFYCDNACQQKFIYMEKINLWKSGNSNIASNGFQIKKFIRVYLFDKYDGKCTNCGWSEKNPITKNCPLEVEHIDGNSNNNLEENLTLLCPNCHSLTPTYKSLNRGKGRKQRMKRYYEGKTF